MKQMWKLKQAADSIPELYIYGDVEGDGYGWFGEKIESETSANHLREALARYPNAQELRIYINSYGGSVFEGTAIYNQLRRCPARKTVYIDGFACSIASVIAMAGDEIIMPANTLMMIHNMSLYTCGNAAQLRKAADDLDTINAAGRAAYLARAGEKLDEAKLAEMMDAETWLTAQQCIEYGLADRIAAVDADLTQAAALLQRIDPARVHLPQELAARLRPKECENREEENPIKKMFC